MTTYKKSGTGLTDPNDSGNGMPTSPRDTSGSVLFPSPAAPADNSSNPTSVTQVQVFPMLYSGSGVWDRDAGNLRYTMLTSAAYPVGSGAQSPSSDSGDYTNPNGRYLDVVLDVTNANGGTAVIAIYGKDVASSKYYLLLQGANVTTNSTNVYRVGPGLAETANVSTNKPVPRIFKVVVTITTATMTFSVGSNVCV